MAEITRSDIAADDVLKLPLELSENFQVLVKSLDDVIAKSKQLSDGLGKDSSLPKIKADTESLTETQIELNKVQGQVATVLAKNNEEYREQQKILADLKQQNKEKLALGEQEAKQVTAANASRLQLSAALDSNRLAYSKLVGETERSSKAGVELLKTIQQQKKDFEKLSDSMGLHQAHVGGYREEIEKLLPGLRKINPEAVEAGEGIATFGGKLLAVVTSPIGLTLAAIAGSFLAIKTALETFFTETVEGQDRAAIETARWSAYTEVLKDKWADVGKAIANATGIGEQQSPASDAFRAVLGFYFPLKGYLDDVAKKQRELVDIAVQENAIRKEEIVLSVELAQKNLEKSELLFEARDKLLKTDQERYEALLKARKVTEGTISLQLTANANERKALLDEFKSRGAIVTLETTAKELLEDKIKRGRVNYEEIKRLAALEIEEVEIQKKLYDGTRRTQQLKVAIVNEAMDRLLASEKQQSNIVIAEIENVFNKTVATNSKIVGNQTKSVQEQIEAQKELADAKLGLLNLEITKEDAALREQLFSKIELSAEESEAINKLAGKDLKLRVELIRQEKNAKIGASAEYGEALRNLLDKQTLQEANINRESGDNIAKIIEGNYRHFIEIRKRFIQEDAALALANLNKQFVGGGLTNEQYEAGKTAIQQQAAAESARIDLQEHRDAIQELQKYLSTKTDLTQAEYDILLRLQKEYVAAQQATDEASNVKRIAAQKDYNTRALELRQQLFTTAASINDSLAQSAEIRGQEEMDTLQAQKEQELQMAGDNKHAIDQINREYAEKEKAINREVAAEKRRAAIFDKLLALAQIGINTEKAASEALAKYGEFSGPVIAEIVAIGIAQAAIVLAKPIPKYETGTKNHPGGPAIVGEDGVEFLNIPGKGIDLTPNAPTLMDLPAGTEVIPNEATMKILALSGLLRSSDYNKSAAQTNQGTEKLLKELTHVVKNKRELHLNFTRQGVEALFKYGESRIRILRDFYA